MYVYIDISIYRQTYVPIYHKMYIWHEQIYVYIHIHTHTRTHIYIYMYVYANICKYKQSYLPLYDCGIIYIYTHTYIGMFIYNVCP